MARPKTRGRERVQAAAIRRYAIYFAPEAGSALGRFGAGWLGWDAEAGRAAGPLAVPGLPRPAEEITAAPRRYGFHATLKAPFRLVDGMGAEDLAAAAGRLAAGHRAFVMPRLALVALGRFLALVPAEACPPLDALAAECVTGLDGFRAPMPAEEQVRRAVGLDPREAAHLVRWGYPFVLDRFRFHLTLSGPLDDDERSATAAALATVLAPILAERHPFAAIALFGEGPDGRFRLLRRFPLAR
jgi:putative phosphonate metabolism protein